MKIASMQPYLFPYLGYFQLINSVDKFVIYDDVQYGRHSWYNRNYIQDNCKPRLFSFSVKKDSHRLNINERYYHDSFSREVRSFLKGLKQIYGKTKYFPEVFELMKNIFDFSNKNIAVFNANSLIKISEYLGITTEFIVSSKIEKNNFLRGQDSPTEKCKKLSATQYINAIGGQKLYNKEFFAEENIQLNFIKMHPIEYNQFSCQFIPNLSIIDVMMFNDVKTIKKLLNKYELI